MAIIWEACSRAADEPLSGSQRRWIALGGLVLILAALSLWSELKATDIINTGALLAVAWYTLETSRSRQIQESMRDHQREAEERENHPWLAAATLVATWKNVDPFGEWSLALPIKNCGKTPALDLRVRVRWLVTGRDHDEETRLLDQGIPTVEQTRLLLSGGTKREVGALVPGDTCHVVLDPIKIPDREALTEIGATILYRTVSGGTGELEVYFKDDRPGEGPSLRGWRNLPTRYDTFPRKP